MTSVPESPETLHALMRTLPSMNLVLEALSESSCQAESDEALSALSGRLSTSVPRPMLREAVESYLSSKRSDIRQGLVRNPAELALSALLPGIVNYAALATAPHFKRVINATGVVVHTNLGRSLLAEEAADAVAEAVSGYSNLEFDIDTGERGSRYTHVEPLICRLTGAEAALVVNNNAAAVFLVLDTLCKGREVVISRGELVEIGGSFRIPAVMEKSGCILREVGATNRTHPADYMNAITENTAALMKVHTSNFRIVGFTSDVSRKELSALATDHKLPLLEDLGSGMLLDLAAMGYSVLAGEPAVRQVLADGVDVVTFSGDKVLGGPQAGIIAGKAEYIHKIKKNPLNRALRIDKMTLAALEATFRLYMDPDLAKKRIPTIRMICMEKEALRQQAGEMSSYLSQTSNLSSFNFFVREGESQVGGGAFPECNLPTFLVCAGHKKLAPNTLQHALLRNSPPILARVENDALCFDPRTLCGNDVAAIAEALYQTVAPQETTYISE